MLNGVLVWQTSGSDFKKIALYKKTPRCNGEFLLIGEKFIEVLDTF
jgi:hypothetical protein